MKPATIRTGRASSKGGLVPYFARSAVPRTGWAQINPLGAQYEAFKNELYCIEKAVAIRKDKAETVELPAVVRNVNVLTAQGIAIPKSCRQIHTARIVSSELSASVLGAESSTAIRTWATRLVFSSADEGAGDDWDIDNPSFAFCSPSSAEEAADDKHRFKRMFSKACFGDAFVAAWRQSLVGGSGTGLLVEMGRAVLDQFSLTEMECTAPWQVDVIAPTLSLWRGLVAQAFPVPLAYGSTLTDVLYCNPDKKCSPLAKDIPTVGKLVVGGCLDDALWQGRKKAFKNFAGAECTHGPALWQLLVDVEALPVDSAISVLLPYLQTYTENIDRWRRSLRPGSTAPVELAMEKLMRHHMEGPLTTEEVKAFELVARAIITQEGKLLHASLLQQN